MKRSAFTLVELLVVVAIISVLAAMLLPSLGQALEQTRRTVDLNHHRQLALLTAMYASDNRDYMIYPASYWTDDMTLRSVEQMGGSHNDPNSAMRSAYRDPPVAAGRRYTMAWGAMRLVTEKLLDDPGLLFCPSFPRPVGSASLNFASGASGGWYFDKPEFNAIWRGMREQRFASVYVSGSYESLQYCQDPRRGSDGFMQLGRPDTTFHYVAEHWRESTYVGPMLYACTNASAADVPEPAYWPHRNEGNNASYFDGSARFVDWAEVGSTNIWSLVDVAAHGAFNQWERKKATLSRPR